jgi:hypothetical protein
MKHLRKFNEMLDPMGSWDPEPNRLEVTTMENGKYYTRIWPDGDKCIFKFKKYTNDKDYVEVYMSCSNFQEDFSEDFDITISKDGTGKDSIVVESNPEEINFLQYIKKNWRYDTDGKGYLDLPYDEVTKLFKQLI